MDNGAGDAAMTAIPGDEVDLETPKIDMIIKIEGEVKVKAEGSLMIIEEEVKITSRRVDVGCGKTMILEIVIEIIGIETTMAKITGVEVGDGKVTEDRVIVIEDGEGIGTRTSAPTTRLLTRLPAPESL